MVKVYNNVRDLREAAGMSQLELARRMGVNPSTVCRWEMQKTVFDTYVLGRLCEIFRVSPNLVISLREEGEA